MRKTLTALAATAALAISPFIATTTATASPATVRWQQFHPWPKLHLPACSGGPDCFHHVCYARLLHQAVHADTFTITQVLCDPVIGP